MCGAEMINKEENPALPKVKQWYTTFKVRGFPGMSKLALSGNSDELSPDMFSGADVGGLTSVPLEVRQHPLFSNATETGASKLIPTSVD